MWLYLIKHERKIKLWCWYSHMSGETCQATSALHTIYIQNCRLHRSVVNHKLKPSFCFSLPLQTNFISVQWYQCIAALTSFKILKNWMKYWINCTKYLLSSVNDHQFIKLDTCDEGKAIKSWTCCSEIWDCSGLWLVKREPRRNFLNYSLLTIFRILRFTIWTHFNRCEITPFVVLIFVIQPSPSSGYQSPVQSRHISASTRWRYLFNLQIMCILLVNWV